MKGTWKILIAGLLAMAVAAPAAAAVDGEVELRYWQNDVKLGGDGSDESAGAPGAGLRAEIALIKRLAFAFEYFELTGEDEFDGTDITEWNLDAKWRIVAPSENTFFALGLGYGTFEVGDSGESFDSDGFRIVADGRFGFIGILYVYGRLAYMPSLSDLTIDGFTFAEGDNAYNFEIGLGIEPIPILSLWVGYRMDEYKFKEPGGGSGRLSLENSGAFLGAGIHF